MRPPGVCVLCQRYTELTLHHLIPRKLHRRTHYKKRYSKAELQQGILVCRLCHRGIHNLYDEMTLAKQLNSLEKLQNDTAITRHAEWVSKQR